MTRASHWIPPERIIPAAEWLADYAKGPATEPLAGHTARLRAHVGKVLGYGPEHEATAILYGREVIGSRIGREAIGPDYYFDDEHILPWCTTYAAQCLTSVRGLPVRERYRFVAKHPIAVVVLRSEAALVLSGDSSEDVGGMSAADAAFTHDYLDLLMPPVDDPV